MKYKCTDKWSIIRETKSHNILGNKMSSKLNSLYPWPDGHYKSTGCLFDNILVTGNTGHATGLVITLEHGEVGEADPKVAELYMRYIFDIYRLLKMLYILYNKLLLSNGGTSTRAVLAG